MRSKKILLTAVIAIVALFAMSNVAQAATVKITADVINVRKEASTDSDVIAKLSKGVECEYLGEEGDWYKVTYGRYTGYVTKEYAELVEDSSDDEEEETTDNSNSEETENSETTETEETNTQSEENQSEESKSEDTTTGENADEQESSETETAQITYKEFNQNTVIRILPLIYSGNIGEAKTNDEVLVLTETSGWSYVQTDEISGWVRTDTLGEAKTSNQEDEGDATTEEIGYISESSVNMRKGAGTTYSVIKTLSLNTQVTILGEEDGWYKVKVGDTTGYVSKDYVSDSKQVTSRSLSEPRTSSEADESDTTTEQESSASTSNSTTSSEVTTTTTSTTTNTATTSSTNTTTTSTTTSTASSTTTASTSSESDTIKGTDVIAYAKQFLGYKYVWAGDGSNGTFDCSGFTMYVYKHFGVSLPHYTVSQYNSSKGTKITNQSDLQMGDIVFLTDYETGAACGHCGIYISNGDFIHADSSVGYVNISNLNGIYKGRFCGALRII